MKTRTFELVALLAIGCLTLAGCNDNNNPDENVEIANPASVYCKEQGGTLNLEEGLCLFPDGSYCEEGAYYRDECHPGEIIYNTVSDNVEPNAYNSEIFSDKDLTTAEATIMDTVNNEWQVKIEMQELFYAGDETAAANVDYCKNFNPEITECAVFTSNFYIPAQDAEMAGAFEPDSTINGWSWYLGKNTAGEWEVLTNGFG